MLKGLIACVTAIVLLLGALGWQTFQLGEARTEAGAVAERLKVCQQATQANLDTVRELQDELDHCVGEQTAIESEHMAAVIQRAHQAEQLAREVEDLQAQIRAAIQPDDCAGQPVPADAVELMRQSFDRAHRAGGEEGAPMGARAR